MDAYYSKNTTPENVTKAVTTRHVESINFTDEGSGFCICPHCFHFIFDEELTGICPSCQHRFCPSCSFKKHKL